MMLKSLDEVKMTISGASVMTFACYSILFASLKWIKSGRGQIMDPCGTPVYVEHQKRLPGTEQFVSCCTSSQSTVGIPCS